MIRREIADTIIKPLVIDHYASMNQSKMWFDGPNFICEPLKWQDMYAEPIEKPADVMAVTRQMCGKS